MFHKSNDFMYCYVLYPVVTSSYMFMLWIWELQFDVGVGCVLL